ncbi:MAG: cbb3-type cytochrome oxidase assembly protein CcoS [Halomonadaceae bacterium]|nr:MAG: cbb3-type cytochrome oxidase assembly protein CcoS [Halomonadaceae bacterium]
MSILYLLIPLSLILVGIALTLFIWAVKNEQFEDLDGPAHSILYDDDVHRIPPEAQVKKPAANNKPTDKDETHHG